jgi:hypothetical protein
MGRATIAEERNSTNARVVNSLPPMLSNTVGKRWAEKSTSQSLGSKQTGPKTVKQASLRQQSSTLRSPLFKLVADEVSASQKDSTLAQSSLASKRLSTVRPSGSMSSTMKMVDVSTSSLAKVQSDSRGLRPVSLQKDVPFLKSVQSKQSSNALGSDLASVVRRQIVKTIAVTIPTAVSRTVDSLGKSQKNLSFESGKSKLSAEVVEVLEQMVLREAQTQIEDIFASASISSMEQLMNSTGTNQSAIRRVETIVGSVVKQLVKQVQQSGVVQQLVETKSAGSSAVMDETPKFRRTEQNVVIERLQAKGVRRKLAERLVNLLPVSAQDVRYSIDEIVSQVLE